MKKLCSKRVQNRLQKYVKMIRPSKITYLINIKNSKKHSQCNEFMYRVEVLVSFGPVFDVMI